MSNVSVPAAATGLPSRRLFLAAGPASVVFASLRQAVAAEPDPIFALIAEHERLDRAWLALDWRLDDMAKDDPSRDAVKAELEAALSAYHEARDLLETTPPQTLAGVIAYLREISREYRGCVLDVSVIENALRSPALSAPPSEQWKESR